jgi:hypothetical protein
VVLAAQVISMQAVLAHQVLVFYSAVGAAVQDLLALVQMLLPITAVTAAQVAVVEAVLLQQALQVQAVTALSFYTTKEF